MESVSRPEDKGDLERDQVLVSPFKQALLEKDARKNWDLFYKRNSNKFFKDRHWTAREFPELLPQNFAEKKMLLEVGCGCGNAIFPLIEEHSSLFVYACDFSPRAVQIVKDHPMYSADHCKAFQCDVTKDELSLVVKESSIDLVLLIFVLSAIHPTKMHAVLENIRKVMKPGGAILFRDYGLYDHAMLRFSSGHKLGECFYVRQDGTRAYYFSQEKTAELFTSCGFCVVENNYVNRRTVNKKKGLDVARIFVQGKFMKN